MLEIGEEGLGETDNHDVCVSVPTHVIEPNSQVVVDVRALAYRLGRFVIPLRFGAKASPKKPVNVDVNMEGVGPIVEVSSKEVKFGKIQVLNEHLLTLSLKNTSPIPANYTCEILNDKAAWKVSPASGTLNAGFEKEIQITANLNDTIKFTDILKISVQNGPIHEIQLVAQGTGTTIVYDEEIKNIDFSEVYSNRSHEKSFLVENKGRRAQTLQFTSTAKMNEGIYEILPVRFTLRPGNQQSVVVKAISSGAILHEEKFNCTVTIDKEPTRKMLFESLIKAQFVTPIVTSDQPSYRFKYVQGDLLDENVTEQEILLINKSPLPCHMSLHTSLPFVLENVEGKILLEPGDCFPLKINFDYAYKKNRVSAKHHTKLHLNFDEHPTQQTIDLHGESHYPNLEFSRTIIDFQSTTPFVSTKETLSLSNYGDLPAHYEWMIERKHSSITYEDGSVHAIDPSLFDITPRSGVIMPNKSQEVGISFFSKIKGTFHASLICKIRGGPVYRIVANVSCSDISYSLSSSSIDFGQIYFNELIERTLELKNTGNIEIPLAVWLNESDVFNSQKYAIHVSHDKLVPGQSATIRIRYISGFPGPQDDFVCLQIAHLEPLKISVKAEVVFPQIVADLPYSDTTDSSVPTSEKEVWSMQEKISAFYYSFIDQGKDHWSDTNREWKLMSQKKASVFSALFEKADLVLSTYVLDFHHVGRNQSQKKFFNITNNGKVSLSFSFDKTSMEERGYFIDSDKPVTLKPDDKHVIGIQFKAPKNLSVETVIETALIVQASHGIRSKIILRATVNCPSITLSSSSIDFGDVFAGQKKSFKLKVKNTSSVLTEWSTKIDTNKAKPTKKAKELSDPVIMNSLTFEPAAGILSPGEERLVKVHFCPIDNMEFDFNYPVKIINSQQITEISLKGKGILPALAFDRTRLVYRATTPYSDSLDEKITVSNPTKYLVELFSIDFDPFVTRSAIASTDVEIPGTASKEPGSAKTKPISPAPQSHFVFYGPPLTGKTTTALQLCEQHGYTYLSINDMIVQALDSKKPIGDKVREEIFKWRELSQDNKDEDDEDTADSKVVRADFDTNVLQQLIMLHVQNYMKEGSPIFVVDGLECKYIKSPITVLKTVLQAFEALSVTPRFQLIHFTADIGTIFQRECENFEKQVQRACQYPEVDEKDMDDYSSEQQEEIEGRFFEGSKIEKRMRLKREEQKNAWRSQYKVVEENKKIRQSAHKTTGKQAHNSKRSVNSRSRMSINDKLHEGEEESAADNNNNVAPVELFEEEETYR